MKKANHFTRRSALTARFATPGLLLLLFCADMGRGYAQSKGALAEIRAAFTVFATDHLAEKLYVQTDKTGYVAGETIWLKIYVVDGWQNHPLSLSKVAYVDLLDLENRPVLQTKLAMDDGNADGTLLLPDTLATGNYRLRAYTSWMKNAPPEYYFHQTIAVLQPGHLPVAAGARPADIRFFPEGGDLVNDLESTVAFQLSDGFGKGLDLPGSIVDDDRDTLLRFRPVKSGIGRLVFTPHAGHSYKAVFTVNRKPQTTALPVAKTAGYVMHVVAEGGKISVTAAAGGTSAPNDSVYLFIQSHGLPGYGAAVAVSNGKAAFLIDTAELAPGVSQMTLFSGAGQPVAERLFFKFPFDNLSIGVQSDRAVYKTRQKISLAVTTTNAATVPRATNLSLSVYRLDALQTIPAQTIDSYFWLGSDFAGAVESPESYFAAGDARAAETMDNLMLTGRWQKFSWDQVLHPSRDRLYPPETKGHLVTGRVINRTSGRPGPFVVGFASVVSKGTFLRSGQSDSAGTIRFEMPDFSGNESLVVQTNTVRDSIFRMEIENPFSTRFAGESFTKGASGDTTSASATGSAGIASAVGASGATNPTTGNLTELPFNTQIENVFRDDSAYRWLPVNRDTTAFYGRPEFSYRLDDYTRFTTMEEVMREYISPVNVLRSGGRLDLVLKDKTTDKFFTSGPLVLVDGVPYFDIDRVMHFDPLRVRRIELVNRQYFFGTQTYDGIVNFITYKGDLGGIPTDSFASVLPYEGMQLRRAFYAPAYDNESAVRSRLPDFRSVLCWKSDLATGADGKIMLPFFSSDLPGKYAVVVQGITKDGLCGSRTVFFTVEK